MAVEVVGTDDRHIKETSCRNCAAKLRYTEADVASYTKQDYDGGSSTYYYIACPRCRDKVIVRSY